MGKLIQDAEKEGFAIQCNDRCGILDIENLSNNGDDAMISIGYFAQHRMKKKCQWEIIIDSKQLNELIENLIEMRDRINK